jgi:ammonium transporter Rh
VAIGASARLEMSPPGGAFLLGVLAGLLSVIGYVYVTPMLEKKLVIYDTCGVHNLHGLPSFLGGLASAVFVTIDSSADFLEHAKGAQAARQIEAVLATLVVALASGYLTGFIMVKAVVLTPAEYDDAAWWESEYLEGLDCDEIDKSQRSRASITPDASEPGV